MAIFCKNSEKTNLFQVKKKLLENDKSLNFQRFVTQLHKINLGLLKQSKIPKCI